MIVRKSDYFIADVELQYEWYAEKAGWNVADRYLDAIASTCALIERSPLLGPAAAFNHPRLAAWRFFVVLRPFHRHLVFYEYSNGEIIFRRALHGQRHFPQRLIDPPGAE